MNIKDIKALASVLQQADLTALEYSEGDMHIKLERAVAKATSPTSQTLCEPLAVPAPSPVEERNDFNNMNEVKAPMVGVFYAAPAPGTAPFVKVGDNVEKGQVICLIEAMKLMNDITAPVAGRIVDICALDGAVLEYGQTIMKIV